MAEDNIKVAIRIRPLINREIKSKLKPQWNTQNKTIFQIDDCGEKNSESAYSFDHIFEPDKSNREIYDAIVKDFIESSLNGINSTIFAYGQTSSGKTYTMFGNGPEKGLIPIAIDNIFTLVDSSENKKFLLRISFVEIYNEKINDLLDPTNTDLKIREDIDGNILLQNIHEEIVSTREQVYECLKRGDINKHVGQTKMNEKSSRAHTIFKIMIECRDICDFDDDDDSSVQISNLNLVDLAGSERAAQTKATGTRLKEGGHINKSLSTLAHVIRQLSEGKSFISFRDSKLTRLLQQSLGGNAKTLIIATITLTSVENTSSTLSFAQRAKAVKNAPKVNEVLNDADAKKRYAQLNDDLKKKLDDELLKNKNLTQTQEENYKEILRLQEQIKAIEKFQQHTIENSSLTSVVKRRHTIAFSGQKKQLKAILEEPSEGVETASTLLFLESTPFKMTTSSSSKTTEQSVQCSNLSGEFSTPKSNLRDRIMLLEQDYDELVTYTRDENNLLAETDERVEKLETQLKSTLLELSETKQQRKVEEEFITTQLTNKFKTREQNLLDKINDLEKQLAYKNKPVSDLPVRNINDNISQELIEYDDCFLNFNNREYVQELKKQLILLHGILGNCEFVENPDTTFEKSRIEDIIDSFSLKIKTSKEIIENEIWKQVNISNQMTEKLNHSYIIPNEIDSFNKLLKELLAFENDVSVELMNNNEDVNVETLRILIKIYESLVKQNQIIGWCSEKISSLQDEMKSKDETYVKFKADINDQLIAQKATISELDLQLEQKNNTICELENNFVSSQTELHSLEERCFKLREEIESNKTTIEELNVELANRDSAFVNLENKYTSSQKELNLLIEKCDDINSQLVAQKATISDLNLQLEQKNNTIRELEDKFVSSQTEIHSLEELCLKLREEMKSNTQATREVFNLELSNRDIAFVNLENKYTSSQKELNLLTEKCDDFNAQLTAQKATISDLNLQLEQKNNTIRELEDKFVSSQTEIHSLEEQCFKLREKMKFNTQATREEINLELSNRDSAFVNLENKYISSQKELSFLVEKCGAAEENVNIYKNRVLHFENLLRDQQNEICSLKAVVDNVTLENDLLKREMEELKLDNNYKLCIKESEDAIAAKNMQTDYLEVIKDLETALKIKNSFIQQLESTIEKITEQFIKEGKALLTIKPTQDQRNYFKDNRKSLKVAYVDIKEQLQLLQKKSYDLDKIYQSIITIHNIIDEYCQLERSKLQSEINQVETTNKAYINEITVLKKRQEDKKDCLNCQSMKSEILRLNQKLSNKEKMLGDAMTNCSNEKDVSCQQCAQLRESNLKLERQVRDRQYEIVALEVKHSEELKKKADLQYSEVLEFYIETEKELRKKVERYEALIPKYKDQIKAYENGSVNQQSVEIQCNIDKDSFYQKYREYKMLAELRKNELLSLKKRRDFNS